MVSFRRAAEWSRRKVRVTGRPRHVGQRVQLGICYLRWLAVAALVLWILDVFILLRFRHHFTWLFPWSVLGPTAVAILPLVTFIFLLPREMTIRAARSFSFWNCLVLIFASALLAGASGLRAEYLPVLNLTLLVVFAVSPLTLRHMAVILLGSVATVCGVYALRAAAIGEPVSLNVAFGITPTVSYAVIGAAVNLWITSNFAQRYKSDRVIERRTAQLQCERLAARQMLERVFTAPVADHLKAHGSFPPALSEVCVIACDIVGFSRACEQMPSSLVVEELKRFFKAFDEACIEFEIEPLRSQGDSRLAVGGLWRAEDAARRIPAVDAVLAMLRFRQQLAHDGADEASDRRLLWRARIGIHTGPVMVGVMDGRRVSLDVWGETVNVAARLEQGAEPNQILVSDKVLWHTRNLFVHGPLNTMQVKNTVVAAAAEIVALEPQYADPNGAPNAVFWRAYRDPEYPLSMPRPGGSADGPYVLRLDQHNG